MRLVIGTAAAAALLAACGKEPPPRAAPPPPSVEVLELAPSEVRETREYLGALMSRRSVTVVPQVAGYVRAIRVRPGQKVEAGAPLLDVDARQESAAVDASQAQVAAARAALALARQNRERTEALVAEGIASVQERDAVRAQAQSAEAALRAAEAQATQRAVQLQYFVVRAPFAGVVGDVLVRQGALVTAQTPLTTLSQADVLEVTVSLPAERARRIRPGAVLELLDGDGSVRVATNVFYVAEEADPRTQLVEVKGAFTNGVGLRPSELVRARVVYDTKDALQVPVLSVVRQSGQAFVFGVKEAEGRTVVERRPVTLGALGASHYVVESGLQAGDRIAVSSIQTLRDGASIAPRRSEPEAAPSDAALGVPHN